MTTLEKTPIADCGCITAEDCDPPCKLINVQVFDEATQQVVITTKCVCPGDPDFPDAEPDSDED